MLATYCKPTVHAMCETCYWASNTKRPHRVPHGNRLNETCCFCGSETESGIYKEGKPETFPCKGEHEKPQR
jgi:hypothetical protein